MAASEALHIRINPIEFKDLINMHEHDLVVIAGGEPATVDNHADRDRWERDPHGEFQAFVKTVAFVKTGRRHQLSRNREGRVVRTSVQHVYSDMFAKFLRYMKDKEGKHFLNVQAQDIRRFLNQGRMIGDVFVKDLQSKIALRYLRLLERLYIHLQIWPNPALQVQFDAFRNEFKLGTDAQSVTLTADEEAAIMNALPVCQSRPRKANDPFHGWKRVRDRAMIAMMLGAGLRVNEVIAIAADKLGEVDAAGNLPIKVSGVDTKGSSLTHDTRLHAFAVPEVLQWVALRQQMGFKGTLLFPAKRDEVDVELTRTTVYRQVKATFERAGVSVDHIGGRTLRNTFAVREIRMGTPLEAVKEYLGLVLDRSADNYVELAQLPA